MSQKAVVLIFASVLGLGTYALWHFFPDALNSQDGKIQLISTIAILSYLFLSLSSRRSNLSTNLKSLMIWVGIFVFGLWGYSFKDRILGVLVPSAGQEHGQTISYKVSDDGHFYVTAKVNGERVRFMVDSGASGITLAPEDAKRLGYDLSKLNYNNRNQTAGGQTFSASITLETLEVESQTFQNLPAQVPNADLQTSLLGMTFLSRLKSWRVEGDELLLEF